MRCRGGARWCPSIVAATWPRRGRASTCSSIRTGLASCRSSGAPPPRPTSVPSRGQAPVLAERMDARVRGGPGGGDRTARTPTATTLDLHVCNSEQAHPVRPGRRDLALLCPQRQDGLGRRAATETEPSGAFPRVPLALRGLRSARQRRRIDDAPRPTGQTLTQLKGSAFFDVDVARQPGEARDGGCARPTPTTAPSTRAGTSRCCRRPCTQLPPRVPRSPLRGSGSLTLPVSSLSLG